MRSMNRRREIGASSVARDLFSNFSLHQTCLRSGKSTPCAEREGIFVNELCIGDNISTKESDDRVRVTFKRVGNFPG